MSDSGNRPRLNFQNYTCKMDLARQRLEEYKLTKFGLRKGFGTRVVDVHSCAAAVANWSRSEIPNGQLFIGRFYLFAC